MKKTATPAIFFPTDSVVPSVRLPLTLAFGIGVGTS